MEDETTPDELREHVQRVLDAEPDELADCLIVTNKEWQSARLLAEKLPKLLEVARCAQAVTSSWYVLNIEAMNKACMELAEALLKLEET